jgi:hypothetical protein
MEAVHGVSPSSSPAQGRKPIFLSGGSRIFSVAAAGRILVFLSRLTLIAPAFGMQGVFDR